MKNIFSDKVLLFAGILLLLVNLGVALPKLKQIPLAAAEVPNQAAVMPVDRTLLNQVFQAGLVYPVLHWKDELELADEFGKKHTMKEVLGNSRKLVFRFSEFSCNTCVDREMENLKRIAATLGKDNILLLATYGNLRDLAVFKRINHLEFPVFNIPEQVLSTEKVGGTFLFVADNQLKAYMPFIPDKENGDLSLAYYDYITPLFQ